MTKPWYCWNCNKVVKVEDERCECPSCKYTKRLIPLSNLKEVRRIAQDLRAFEREVLDKISG